MNWLHYKKMGLFKNLDKKSRQLNSSFFAHLPSPVGEGGPFMVDEARGAGGKPIVPRTSGLIRHASRATFSNREGFPRIPSQYSWRNQLFRIFLHGKIKIFTLFA